MTQFIHYYIIFVKNSSITLYIEKVDQY